MMDRTVVRWMIFVGVAAALAAGRARAESAPVVARFADGRLSVSATDASLEDVVREVARVVGAEVKGTVATPRQVTITLEEMPLEEALRRVLGEQPYSLRYDRDKLVEVALVDVGSPTRKALAGAPGVLLPNGERYFAPPEARVVRDPTPAQLEAAKAEFLAAQRPLDPPSEAPAGDQ
jgi:hypothetical protein